MIRQLEDLGLQMAKEKQDYIGDYFFEFNLPYYRAISDALSFRIDQLQSEARALHDEQERTEELEKIREELEKERSKMESLTTELKDQYQAVQTFVALVVRNVVFA